MIRVRIVWLREGNCPGIQMWTRVNRRANRRIWLIGSAGIIVFRSIADQESLQFPDCVYVRFQVRFRISSYVFADRKPTQIAL